MVHRGVQHILGIGAQGKKIYLFITGSPFIKENSDYQLPQNC